MCGCVLVMWMSAFLVGCVCLCVLMWSLVTGASACTLPVDLTSMVMVIVDVAAASGQLPGRGRPDAQVPQLRRYR